MTTASKPTTAELRALYGITPRKGTAHMKHPKRGGWKGAKQSKRNHAARERWLAAKKSGTKRVAKVMEG